MSNQVESSSLTYEVPRPQLGILLCLLSMLVFAGQDGITKVLVRDLPVTQLVMVRYWVFLAFAIGYCACQGGVRQAFRYATASTLQPFNYSLLVFATLIGLFVFDKLPDVWTVVGACMIIAAARTR